MAKTGFFKQLGLLMWKNLKLYIRRPCTLVFEIGFPIFYALIMVAIRSLITRENVDTPTYYEPFSLHHTGALYPYNMEIGYVPDYNSTQTIMDDVISQFNAVPNRTVTKRGFSDAASLVSYYQTNTERMRLAVVFNNFPSSGSVPTGEASYTVRPATNDSQRWFTTSTFPFYQQNAPNDRLPDYIPSYTSYLMTLVGEAILRQWGGGGSSPTLDLTAQKMPYPPYYKDSMIIIIQNNLPLFLMLSFILTVVQTTKAIVTEKEKRIKESMKLMGLRPSAHWASWFLTTFIYLALALAVYAILFGIKVNSKVGAILAKTDISLFYVFLLVYALALISYCFMISAIIQRANVGAAVAGILFFGFYFPAFVMQLSNAYETMDTGPKLGLCLLFNMAMAYGAKVISLFEGTGEGAKWSNFRSPAIVDDNFTLAQAMGMLLFDAVLYLLITWYIDNVRPGEFGVPKPFYFCFTKRYWCSGCGQSDTAYETSQSDGVYFEKEPTHLKPGIQICNLTKSFGKGKIAVDKMQLNMYEGQITVLLGHNGAGKTTTMSMITGFIPPTSGTALVNGFDISTDIDGVRSSLGLCPQHNILWDTLTVEEHLRFFAEMKGSDPKTVAAEVQEMIKEVGLEGKKNTHAGNLSGGQKRKLSVGIALISGSKVVVLDEPSSGMDPAARRQLWELLQRHRHGRTILLTTHYMDEADVLGDRIAIMAGGVVKCCGSSLFLKKLFGAGYHLVVVKDDNCKVPTLTETVRSKIPTSTLESEVNAEVTYLLPDDQSAKFPDLFRYLDQHQRELGILGFGTSATTLEEVFLKVGEESFDDITAVDDGTPKHRPSSAKIAITNGSAKIPEVDITDDIDGAHSQNGTAKPFQNGKAGQHNGKAGQHNGTAVDKPNGTAVGKPSGTAVGKHNGAFTVLQNGTHSDSNGHPDVNNIMFFNSDYQKVTGLRLQLSQFHGMFVKKVLLSWRHRVISVVQLVLPVVFTILALIIKPRDWSTEKDLSLDMSPFGPTYVAYSNGTAPNVATQGAATVYSGQFPGHYLRDVDLDNVTGYNNMSHYLVGLASDLTTSVYSKKVIVGAQFDGPSNGTLKATSFYSGQPYHALPISISYVLNALAKQLYGISKSFSLSIHPLPKDEEAAAQDSATSNATQGFLVGFCIMFGMAFLTSSFVYFLVKEREVGAKHLQVVSGVSPGMFWLATFVWDYLNYLVPTFAMLVVFAGFRTEAYVQDGRLGMVLLVLLLYGWAALGFVYLVSFLFKSPPSAMVILIIFNIVTGLVTTITVYIIALPSLGIEEEAKAIEWIFIVLFPNYCMAKSFMDIFTNYLTIQTCVTLKYTTTCPIRPGVCCKSYGKCFASCLSFDNDYMAWESPGIGRFLLFMAIQGFVFLAVVLILDLRIIDKLKAIVGKTNSLTSDVSPVPLRFINGHGVSTDATEDSDVARERERVNNLQPGDPKSDPLVLMNLHKRYGHFTAVDQICVGVPEQECFGLLGQNGAGKTTTFKMLTGDVSVTGGNAYLNEHNIVTNIKQVQQNMGYCPQFDALLDTMTGRETLRMYARLRGVPASHIEGVVDHLIELLMLQHHKDKLAGLYSGGNKRKLSTAIALVGDPPFLLLDEPSSGVDPAARRQLWTVLSQVRASGRTLVLTSHSMEECDALCTRIAIMVNGAFCCLGSPQHLKNKFGHGYTLVVKMGLDGAGVLAPKGPVVERVTKAFAGASIFDDMEGYVHFQVPHESAHVADVFELMERAKHDMHVEDYSVHQTTLEQVFLTFTRRQVAPKEEVERSAIENLCCYSCIKAGCYGKKKEN